MTGAESGGAYFAMEALVRPEGGPPWNIHTKEHETFFVLDGTCTFYLGDQTIEAGPGDFVNIPVGTKHHFHNHGSEPVRMILTFTPAGTEQFFQETLDVAIDPSQQPPDNIEDVSARYAEAAPRYGMHFFLE